MEFGEIFVDGLIQILKYNLRNSKSKIEKGEKSTF